MYCKVNFKIKDLKANALIFVDALLNKCSGKIKYISGYYNLPR
jgi:hypothetical protein